MKGISLLEILITVVIVAVLAFVISPAGMWVPESKAVRALETQGFSDVKIESRHWFLVTWRGCSKGDSVRFDAVAKNPAGKQVAVSVCSGWIWKGATIRSF